MEAIDELSRRRGWQLREGWPIVLGDGQTWNLRMPMPKLGVRINPGFGPQTTLEWSFGPGHEEAAQVFTDSWDLFYGHYSSLSLPEAASERGYCTALDLAYLLLYINYDLSMDEYRCLVGRASPETVQEVFGFILGGLGALWADAAKRWHALLRPHSAKLAIGLPRVNPAVN